MGWVIILSMVAVWVVCLRVCSAGLVAWGVSRFHGGQKEEVRWVIVGFLRETAIWNDDMKKVCYESDIVLLSLKTRNLAFYFAAKWR